MFERPHHRRIAAILRALDAELLAANACWFGGGTAMALRYGEYRESVDIDFLVSDTDGYRVLRERLTGIDGVQAIVRPGALLEASRAVRADQYGIRTLLRTEGVDVKFEIVSERRIALAVPGPADRVCGVATLTPVDLAASKLLANAPALHVIAVSGLSHEGNTSKALDAGATSFLIKGGLYSEVGDAIVDAAATAH